MRLPFCETIERGRQRLQGDMASARGDDFGSFVLRRRDVSLKVIASAGHEDMPWEHVSVSVKNRCPTWDEMAWIKSLFWGDEECVIQYHPPRSEYVSFHPYCLHMWKPLAAEIPRPPMHAVGPKSAGAS